VPLVRCESLADAVARAAAASEPGDVVLMAPACASFDAFADYAERGEAFRALVQELEG
jgi:UDP-N-acetylmuramoylalanine--D-glutamate ligase